MHVDAAISEQIRERIFPDSRLKGSANLLVMPNLDAANAAYNLTRVMTDGIGIGPVLMGMAKPAPPAAPDCRSGLVWERPWPRQPAAKY